jgi:hypothetical protein
MRTEPINFRPQHRLHGVLATIGVHVLLVAAWILSRTGSVEPVGDTGPTIQWINVRPPEPKRPVEKPEPAKRIVVQSKTPPARIAPVVAAPPVAPAASEPVVVKVAEAVAAPSPPSQPAAPARSVEDIMQQARRDIGKIDKELKKAFPERGIRAPIDTAQKRLVKGIELAYELAPPKWYEGAKITEVIDPSGEGRRRYRVVTAAGVMCWTYDGPNTLNGRDHGAAPPGPKVTNCPEHEEPAKRQQW